MMNAVNNGDVKEEENKLFIEAVTVKPTHAQTDDNGDSLGFRTRFKTQPIYRERVLHTVWICLAFIMLGWIEGLFGPTFPDLQLIIDKSLDTSSWLFTATSGGFLVGSLATGFLFDRCKTIVVLVCAITGTAVAIAALPWCPYFYLMLVVRFLSGTMAAGLDTGGNAEVITIWGRESGPFMQTLHFCFSLGGMIAPLVAQPFLATKECLKPGSGLNGTVLLGDTIITLDNGDHNPIAATTAATLAGVDVTPVIDTHSEREHAHYDMRDYYDIVDADNPWNKTDFSLVENSTDCIQVYGTTHVQFAYLISACLLLVTCIPFIVFLIMHRREKGRRKVTPLQRTDKNGFSQLPLYLKLSILFLLSSLMFVYVGIEDVYAGLLMTFTTTQMDWSKAHGSYATSVHWTCFGIGRFAGIFLVDFIRTVKLLSIFSIFLVMSFTGILLTTIFDIPIVLWIFIGLSGFSMSVIFPSVFTWTTESITPVSGKISALFMVSSSLSVMLNPLLFGYTMENYSPMWFVYLLLSQSVFWVFLYIATLVLTKCVLKDTTAKEIKVPENEFLHVNQ